MITESVFSGERVIVSMADVQHMEKFWGPGEKTRDNWTDLRVITKHTRWDVEVDSWANSIDLTKQEADSFLKAWYQYRHELDGPFEGGDK